MHIRFVNKIFDFIYPKVLYATLIHLFAPNNSRLFAELNFGWSYTCNLKSLFYKPQEVFLEFDNVDSPCICMKEKFIPFFSNFPPFGQHVLTTDLKVCFDNSIEALLD